MNASSTETRWQPGQVLLDKYRVDHVLGVGGMGAVIAATHLQLDQRVALKFVHADIAKHPEAVQRFIREARAAAQIRSEHVVRVSDVGKLEDGSPYMVMEYLEGEDLDGALSRGLPGPEVVVDYLLQACAGLLEAHQHGIVHRDLKPANLFLSRRRDGRITVKVLDFGISKVQQPGDAALTQTSSLMGSPLYMSPEQMTRPKEVDNRADIWALGVIAYEALTGTRPFDGNALPEVCGQILAHMPPPPYTLRQEVSARLSAVVMKCLEKEASARYASVADLIAALEPFAPTSQRSRAPSVPGPGSHRSVPPPELQNTQQGTQGAWSDTGAKPVASVAPKKGKTGVLLGAAGAVAALAIGGYFAFRSPAEPDGSTAAQAGLVPEVASAAAKPETLPAAPPVEKPAEAPAPVASPAEAAPPAEAAAPAAAPRTSTKSTKTATTTKAAPPAPAPVAAPATAPAQPAKPSTPPKRKPNPLDIDIK